MYCFFCNDLILSAALKREEEERLTSELDTVKRDNDSLRKNLEREEADKLVSFSFSYVTKRVSSFTQLY